MSDRPRLILHIGHGKVASSTIQGALMRNADDLRSQGWLVADVKLDFPEQGPVGGYPLRVFKEAAESGNGAAWIGERLARLKDRLAAGGYSGAVISSEILCLEHFPPLFRDAVGEFETRVIYYVRRQDEWMESAWKQWGLKRGLPMAEFADRVLARGEPNFFKKASAWRELPVDLRVRPIHALTNVLEDFWQACGWNAERLAQPPKQNQTFDWSLLEVMRLGSFLFEGEHDNKLTRQLDRVLPPNAPRDGHGLLSRRMAERIMDSHREKNRLLREAFFPDLPALDEYPGCLYTREHDSIDQPEALARALGICLQVLGHQGHLAEKRRGEIRTLRARMESVVKRLDELPRLQSRLKEQATKLRQQRKKLKKLEALLKRPNWWRRLRNSLRKRLGRQPKAGVS